MDFEFVTLMVFHHSAKLLNSGSLNKIAWLMFDIVELGLK